MNDDEIEKEAIRIFAVYENVNNENDFIANVGKVDFSYDLIWHLVNIAFQTGLEKD